MQRRLNPRFRGFAPGNVPGENPRAGEAIKVKGMAETAKKLNRSGRSHGGYINIPYFLMSLKTVRDGKERKLSARQLITVSAIHGFSQEENKADFTSREAAERYRFSKSTTRRAIRDALDGKLIEREEKRSQYKFVGEEGGEGYLHIKEWAYFAQFDSIGYLTHNEVTILFYIISQCRNRKGAAIWKASERHIARRLNLSPTTVGKAVERLTEARVLIKSGQALNKYTKTTFSVDENALKAAQKGIVTRAKGISDEAKAAELRAERERFYAHRQKAVLDRVEKLRARARADEAYREAENELRAIELDIAKAEYHHLPTLPDLLERKRGNEAQRAERLAALGMTEEDLLPRYYCEKCSDKGFLPDGRMCDCYKRGRR